jgi:YD repeat-containing protein
MKRLTLLVSCSLVLLAMVSCRKNPVTPIEPIPVAGKLTKLEYSDGAYDSIYYNNQGLISKFVNHYVSPFPYNEIHQFEYDANNKVTRISDNNGETYEYKYIGGSLTAVTHLKNGIKDDYKFYEYQNGKLSMVEEYYRIGLTTSGYQLSSKLEYFYYPDGNLKQEVSYSFDPQTMVATKDFSIEHLDYDSKKNPTDLFSRFLYLYQVPMASRNARKLITKNETNGASIEYNFAYTYDNAGNPLTKKITYLSGGQTKEETIKYFY